MDNEYLCLRFPELLDYANDMLNIPDRDLARRLGVTAQMIAKWRKESSLPQHETIFKLFDLMEMKDVPPAKLDWNYYIGRVLAPTNYEMDSGVDETTGTVLIRNLGTEEVLQIAVSDITIGRKNYEKYQSSCMSKKNMIVYRFSSKNEEIERQYNLFDSLILNPVFKYSQADDLMRAILEVTWGGNTVVGLKMWIDTVKKNPHVFADEKYVELANKLSVIYDYTNKDLLRDEIVEDEELFKVLVRENIYTFRAHSLFKKSLYFIFDIFVDEMKYKDNGKRIKKYVEALFNNENLRLLCSWADFVFEVISQMKFDGMWSSDINHKSVRCLVEPFANITISHEEFAKVKAVLDSLCYEDIWWGRVR